MSIGVNICNQKFLSKEERHRYSVVTKENGYHFKFLYKSITFQIYRDNAESHVWKPGRSQLFSLFFFWNIIISFSLSLFHFTNNGIGTIYRFVSPEETVKFTIFASVLRCECKNLHFLLVKLVRPTPPPYLTLRYYSRISNSAFEVCGYNFFLLITKFNKHDYHADVRPLICWHMIFCVLQTSPHSRLLHMEQLVILLGLSLLLTIENFLFHFHSEAPHFIFISFRVPIIK
jgi:hypothetical protein